MVFDGSTLYLLRFHFIDNMALQLNTGPKPVQNSLINPYPATILCPENVVCFLCLLHIFKCTSD